MWGIGAVGELLTFVGNKIITGTLTVSSVVAGAYYRSTGQNQGYYASAQGAGLHLPSNGKVSWSTSTNGDDNDLRLLAGSPAQGSFDVENPANGQKTGIKQLTELTTIAAAAFTDTAIQLPAGALVLGVSSRVTVQPPGTTTTDIGVAGATTRYGTGISTVVGTTNPGTLAGILYNAAALSVRYTPNATPSDATGRIRTTIHYIDIVPPTS